MTNNDPPAQNKNQAPAKMITLPLDPGSLHALREVWRKRYRPRNIGWKAYLRSVLLNQIAGPCASDENYGSVPPVAPVAASYDEGELHRRNGLYLVGHGDASENSLYWHPVSKRKAAKLLFANLPRWARTEIKAMHLGTRRSA